MLENNNNVNRKLVLNKFFGDIIIKLFNVVILDIVGLYLIGSDCTLFCFINYVEIIKFLWRNNNVFFHSISCN